MLSTGLELGSVGPIRTVCGLGRRGRRSSCAGKETKCTIPAGVLPRGDTSAAAHSLRGRAQNVRAQPESDDQLGPVAAGTLAAQGRGMKETREETMLGTGPIGVVLTALSFGLVLVYAFAA